MELIILLHSCIYLLYLLINNIMLIIFISTSILTVGWLVAVLALWLSGYGGYSQTPWFRVMQLPVFLFSPFSPSRLISNETSIIYLLYVSLQMSYDVDDVKTLMTS